MTRNESSEKSDQLGQKSDQVGQKTEQVGFAMKVLSLGKEKKKVFFFCFSLASSYLCS